MSTVTQIWNKTYLHKLLKEDPLFGKVVIGILILYTFIHIFRLEIYPFYMFAMFSKQEEPREYYEAYKVYDDEGQIDLSALNYRNYTYLMNTISQYDGIMQNEMVHPETVVIDKFVNRLSLDQTSIGNQLKAPFTSSRQELDQKMERWLSRFFTNKNESFSIEKETYRWTNDQPQFIKKSTLYEVD